MAKESPNSFRDPYWTDLASQAERKHGIPAGLLVSVLTNGERSNADQVSEANAKTVFQITPQTRALILKRDGIDPYLNDENAAETAALVLKDGLNWAKGRAQDPAQVSGLAAGFYHAGGDPANWGRKTAAYVQRVTGALPSVLRSSEPAEPVSTPATPAAAPTQGLQAPAGGSMFERAQAASISPAQQTLQNVFDAYQSGKMSPQDAAEFEADVQAGKMMLPRGATLKSAVPAVTVASAAGTTGPMQPVAGAMELPAGVLEAYRDGRMSAADKAQLEGDLQSGLVKLPAGAQLGQAAAVSMIPTGGYQAAPQATAPIAPTTPQSLTQQAIGAGEAGLATVTGLTGGTLGMAGGAVKGLAEQILSGQFGTQQAADAVERSAAEGAQALTYAPRTQAGQAQTEALGHAASALIPIAPLAAEGAALSRAAAPVTQAAKIVAPAAAARAAEVAAPVTRKITTAAGKVKEIPATVSDAVSSVLGGKPKTTPHTAGGSVGAAGTEAAVQRRATAAGLDIPIDLTEGQATRDPAQLKFEVETAKHPEEGGRFRANLIDQNEKIMQNMDAWFDKTGAQAPNLRAVGTVVDDALVKASERDNAHVNVAYATAKNSPEAKVLVDHEMPITFGEGTEAIHNTPIGFLNEQTAGLMSTSMADEARQLAVKIGIADMENGKLVAKPATVRQMEEWRKEINLSTGYEPKDVRIATIMKGLIDGQTEPVSGPLYRQARALRTRYAQNYENRAVISKLLSTKRGSSDRHVAFEDVLAHTILKGSLDDVREVQRVLMRKESGAAGRQAWAELQGATVQWIKNEATSNIATDASGNRILSPSKLDSAIKHLDHDGKLDRIFGKPGAQKLRDANEVAQIARTVPPEAAINTSNTAMTLLSSPFLSSSADIALSMMTGLPAPLLTSAKLGAKHIKDVKLRKRIDAALAQTQH